MSNEMDWSPRPEPKASAAKIVEVAIYDPDAPAGKKYRVMPNIQCEHIQYREGAEPPAARFRYILDDRASARGWPTQFEQILRLHGAVTPDDARPEKSARYVVKTDDRLIVFLRDPDHPKAKPSLLFDGFAQSPQVDVNSKSQSVTFVAAGVAIRCWDKPIIEARWRDASNGNLEDPEHNHVVFGRTIFNAAGQERKSNLGDAGSSPGNATDKWGESPSFFDPLVNSGGDSYGAPSIWTLDRAARYLLEVHNDENYVESPDFAVLKDLLRRRKPKDDSGFYDPSKSDTYEEEPLIVPESDVTGKPWPEALGALLDHHGFAMAFRCEDGGDGEPWNWLEVYRKDGAGPFEPKSIPFQVSGVNLDMAKQGVGAVAATRDFQSAFNAVAAITRPSRYEISVILAPAQNGSLTGYALSRRVWICTEFKREVEKILPLDANRHYDISNATTPEALDLDALWWNPEAKRPERRYPGSGELLSRDVQSNRRKATLHVATGYDGPINAFWNGKQRDIWQPVAPGHGWRLLTDQLGVALTPQDMHAWNIGPPPGGGKPVVIKDMIKMFTDAENPSVKTWFLMLTTVIEDDPGISVHVPARRASALKHPRTRVADVGDAREELIHSLSLTHKDTPGKDSRESRPVGEDGKETVLVYRDDKPMLTDYLKQVQLAHENPPIAGTVTIPWVSEAYQVGDQISEVKGRGLSLQVNAGAEQGEMPRYPYVVGLDWSFDNGQSTTLHLSDRRAEPLFGR